MEINESQAITLLKKYSKDEESFNKVLAHSKTVQKLALKIADNIPHIDKELIATASLLHDIGRFSFPPGSKDFIRHGITGAKLLEKEGLPKHAKVAERHIGIGITKEEIKRQELNLPLKDLVPTTKEEKIIAHADNLTFGHKVGTLKMVMDRYEKELGAKYAKNIKKLADEVESWKKSD